LPSVGGERNAVLFPARLQITDTGFLPAFYCLDSCNGSSAEATEGSAELTAGQCLEVIVVGFLGQVHNGSRQLVCDGPSHEFRQSSNDNTHRGSVSSSPMALPTARASLTS
jgi:hypothetical protein